MVPAPSLVLACHTIPGVYSDASAARLVMVEVSTAFSSVESKRGECEIGRRHRNPLAKLFAFLLDWDFQDPLSHRREIAV